MAKKEFFLIIDTETTIENTVVDFGALICDRKGNIYAECSVLIASEFGVKDLFYDRNAADIWGTAGLRKRQANYEKMLAEGSRMLASVAAVNRWLEKAAAKFNPTMTAYNLAFDLDKMQNTGIDVSMFQNRFCLWHKAFAMFAQTKAYKTFIMSNHLFNAPTKFGNMSFKTNAEVMASFIAGEMLPPEPHTAIEDAKFYELPILTAIVKRKGWKDKNMAFDWKKVQVRDHFKAA